MKLETSLSPVKQSEAKRALVVSSVQCSQNSMILNLDALLRSSHSILCVSVSFKFHTLDFQLFLHYLKTILVLYRNEGILCL